MAKLICRIPATMPSPEEVQAAGIDAWLIGCKLQPEGTLELEAPACWLEQPAEHLPFCLEWQLPQQLTPGQERRAAEQLWDWLIHANHLRIRGQSPLWIADPEQLSHLQHAIARMRLQFGAAVCLWGGGPLGELMDGQYQRPERDLQCLSDVSQRFHYSSYLYHAHHRRPIESTTVEIPAVLPITAAGHNGANYVEATADKYREWLDVTMAWADLRHGSNDHKWVLVENWDGHCRSSPVTKSSSLIETSFATIEQTDHLGWGDHTPNNPALLVHGFHLEKLSWLLHELHPSEDPKFDIYLSTPKDQLSAVSDIIRNLGWQSVEIIGVSNRGRDMAPFFIELLPRVLANRHPWLLKLHTKRSTHLSQGERWADLMRHSLATNEACRQLASWFNEQPQLGLIAPPGSLIPCSVCLEKNINHLQSLLPRVGISGLKLLQQSFVAGSMYAARPEALIKLCDLSLTLDQFEPELGQYDGTLAHALERLIAAVVHDQDLLIKELGGAKDAVPKFGHAWAAPAL
jgi:hypothetical protein